MFLARTGVSVAVAAAGLAALLAVATVWLVLSDPAGVAGALADGAVAPFASLLGEALLNALRGLARYL
ncbi:MAG: hypothetical protein ACE148_04355 [Vicinamibacterales bacterium]